MHCVAFSSSVMLWLDTTCKLHMPEQGSNPVFMEKQLYPACRMTCARQAFRQALLLYLFVHVFRIQVAAASNQAPRRVCLSASGHVQALHLASSARTPRGLGVVFLASTSPMLQ